MKLYDQVTVEGLFELNAETLAEKLNKYSLDGWRFVSLIPSKINPEINLILLEKEVGYNEFLNRTGLVSKELDSYQQLEAHISVTAGKEMYIECVEKSGRIGVAFDTEGTSSWYVVKNNGDSAFGTIDEVQKFIDAVIKYKQV